MTEDVQCGAKVHGRSKCCPCCAGGDPCPPSNLRCCTLAVDAEREPPKRKRRRPESPRMAQRRARIEARRRREGKPVAGGG